MEVIYSIYENDRKRGKQINDCLAKEVQNTPYFYGKGNKGYKVRETGRKMLEEQLRRNFASKKEIIFFLIYLIIN